MFSGIECNDDAVEADADADGEPPGLPVAPGGLLLVGAAMFPSHCLLFGVRLPAKTGCGSEVEIGDAFVVIL